MDYENLCELAKKTDSNIRFAGVINSKGRLIAGGMIPSKKRLGDRKGDEMLYMELALRVKMRRVLLGAKPPAVSLPLELITPANLILSSIF